MKPLQRTALLALGLAMLFLPAYGANSPDRTQWGQDIRVEAGQSVSDLTCFNCSVYVAGNVAGDVTAFGGRVVLEGSGQVAGDVTAFLGDVRVGTGSKIAGDVTAFGGRIHRGSDAQIGGDVTEFAGGGWLALIFGVPLFILGGIIALIVWLVQSNRRPAQVPVRA